MSDVNRPMNAECATCVHFNLHSPQIMRGSCRLSIIDGTIDSDHWCNQWTVGIPEKIRPPKDETWMGVAWLLSEQGSCWKLGVGCVILDAAGRPAATGWNGVEEGAPHCTPGNCVQEHGHCICCIHAEDNALLQAGLYGAIGGVMYITHVPCFRCSRLIVRSKLARVVYDTPYKEMGGAEKLLARGVSVERLALRSSNGS